MVTVVTTIFYNGQFWIALIEKTDDDGKLYLGKYAFGAEPTVPDIRDFYLNRYDRVPLLECGKFPEHRRLKADNAGSGGIPRSLELYKEQQKLMLTERKRIRSDEREEDRKMRFLRKQRKRKQKHRGH